jgi:hypothetical protein
MSNYLDNFDQSETGKRLRESQLDFSNRQAEKERKRLKKDFLIMRAMPPEYEDFICMFMTFGSMGMLRQYNKERIDNPRNTISIQEALRKFNWNNITHYLSDEYQSGFKCSVWKHWFQTKSFTVDEKYEMLGKFNASLTDFSKNILQMIMSGRLTKDEYIAHRAEMVWNQREFRAQQDKLLGFADLGDRERGY